MLTVAAGIIMLGVLVFIHELGHFAIAKINGVKVLKFSLGFGPKIISRKVGETEYLICAIPLGGYVQMLGEGRGELGEDAFLTEEEKERSFAHKSVGKRTAIIAAGPIMNLALPFLILPVAYMVGVNLPAYLDQKTCVGHVVEESDGARSGFVAGDCIVAIGENDIVSWSEANKALISYAGNPLEFIVEREGSTVTLEMPAENSSLEGLPALGLFPVRNAVVGEVRPGMPARAAGMQVGDIIVSINNDPISSWYDVMRVIPENKGAELSVVVDRSDQRVEMKMTPIFNKSDGYYMVGVSPQQTDVFKKFGFVEAVRYGVDRTIELIELTFVFLQKLFTGHVSAKTIGGPIMVVQIAGQAAQTDISSILTVLAFLSIQLGILNLLPIPILDGGHLLFNLAEFVFRRPLSIRIREVAQQLGLIMLLMLMGLAFYNDIMRLFIGGQ